MPGAYQSELTISGQLLGSGTDITSVSLCGVVHSGLNLISQSATHVVVLVSFVITDTSCDVQVNSISQRTSESQIIVEFRTLFAFCCSSLVTSEQHPSPLTR